MITLNCPSTGKVCGNAYCNDHNVCAIVEHENKLKSEQVNHPSHYGGKDNPYEVIKVLENWLTREEFIGAMKFNIHNYLARALKKNQTEDYNKADWYSTYLIDYLKRNV